MFRLWGVWGEESYKMFEIVKIYFAELVIHKFQTKANDVKFNGLESLGEVA